MTRQEASIHKEAILAFLNGAEIEMRQPDGTHWTPTDEPGWLPDWSYRVRKYVAVNVEDLIERCVDVREPVYIAAAIRAYCKEMEEKR